MKSGSFTSAMKNVRRFRTRSLRSYSTLHRSVSFADDAQTQEHASNLHNGSTFLIEAQEEERARIARELHDGIGQELALLIVNMQCPPDVSDSDTRMHEHLLALRAQAERIGTMVRSISHNLHPPELDYLGLKVALESLCRRFSIAWNIPIHCNCSALSVTPDQAVSLSVYRVLQEGLHNIAKHSDATAARVELTATATTILLRISDNGKGFDPKRVAKGLGLQSMKERISSVGGSMSVHSRLAFGTTIELRVPVLVN